MKNRGCPKTKGVRKHRVVTVVQNGLPVVDYVSCWKVSSSNNCTTLPYPFTAFTLFACIIF